VGVEEGVPAGDLGFANVGVLCGGGLLRDPVETLKSCTLPLAECGLCGGVWDGRSILTPLLLFT
jgi:hypothetical protein